MSQAFTVDATTSVPGIHVKDGMRGSYLSALSGSKVFSLPSNDDAKSSIAGDDWDKYWQEISDKKAKLDEDGEEELDDSLPMATYGEVFMFGSGCMTKFNLYMGLLCAAGAGVTYPASAFALAFMFSSLAGSTQNENYMANAALSAYIFMIIGAFSMVTYGLSSAFLENAASAMAYDMNSKWFAALLRQDMSYHDVKAVSGVASSIASNTNKYRRALGRKLGEGIIYVVAFIGGFVYSFWSSWETSLITIAILPFMAGTSAMYTKAAKEQQTFSDRNYAEAGGIVYTSLLAIRTILALNAGPLMMQKFAQATERAYVSARDRGLYLGLTNGGMMASFQVSYMVLTLFGAWIIYRQIRETGCNPSASGVVVETTNAAAACRPSGADVFGAFLGMSMAGMGIPQISVSLELLTKARVAIYPAMEAINRTLDNPGGGQETKDVEEADQAVAPLPKYVIDSSSDRGIKPENFQGDIELKGVSFWYPARANKKVLNDFNLKIKAGTTVALVGPSGGGKSTIIQMLERFYDPQEGSVTIDGINIKEYNVNYLRNKIGLVQQEPTLFATTIGENIRYGRLDAGMDEIQQAAENANAHDFISKFPQGYDTDAGDRGAQLSGGQKQRIAIARTLMKNPSILLLDEATSALDSESELVVQRALDDLLEKSSRTTIMIAHRLSTVRNADMIVFVRDGRVQETGTHEELMAKPNGQYRKLVQAGQHDQENAAEDSGEKTESAVALTSICKGSQDTTDLQNTRVHLRFRDIVFAYPNRPDNIVFNGLNLDVYQGETVALVGPSGQGKSTIVSLIERFYDPASGTVEMLGVDLKQINVRYLRDQIGLVEQEPTLFNMSLAKNIAFGTPDATLEDIVNAAKNANAHDYISKFPQGYDTNVGDRGGQLSGGQKQRVAIARAVLRRPRIMLLDEATSALDGESQNVVQEALDQLANSTSQTTLVIAHRLSTIRLANRVAFIAGGKVQEIGTFDELLAKPNGRFKRLFELQNMSTAEFMETLKEKAHEYDQVDRAEEPAPQKRKSSILKAGEEEEEDDDDAEEKGKKAESMTRRIFALSKDDLSFYIIGIIGALLTGIVFPAWGVMFAYTLQLLYQNVEPCDELAENNTIPGNFTSCQAYFDSKAKETQDFSFVLAYGWVAIIFVSLIGNGILFYGFMAASEKLSKRVRDMAFTALIRQEVAYFDKRNAGDIATQLQGDTGLLQAFTGDPIRVFSMNFASLIVSLILAFVFMWPFALLFLAALPFMAIGSIMEMNLELESDDVEEDLEDASSPGAIALESVTHIRTVASLTLEADRDSRYSVALRKDQAAIYKRNFYAGMAYGLGQLLQNWGGALVFWWGSWLLFNFPKQYNYTDLTISLSGLLFALNGLSMAAQDVSNKDEAQKAAKRIFKLIDRESSIDPLSEEGMTNLESFSHETSSKFLAAA